MIPPSSTHLFDALALALAAGLAASLNRLPGERLPWSWLAASFGILGVYAFLAVGAADPSASTAVGVVRLGAVALASLAMLEFGRRSLHLPGLAIGLPLLALAALGALSGRLGPLEVSCRYALALPGALLAAATLWLAARSASAGRCAGLRVAAVALAAWTVAMVISVPWAAFPPASVVNRLSFLERAGFSAGRLLSLCALGAMTGLWLYGWGAHASRARRWLLPSASLVVVLLGWLAAGAWERSVGAAVPADLAAATAAAPPEESTGLADYRGRGGLGVVVVIFAVWAAVLGGGALVNRAMTRRKQSTRQKYRGA